jgi:hypothetical protein
MLFRKPLSSGGCSFPGQHQISQLPDFHTHAGQWESIEEADRPIQILTERGNRGKLFETSAGARLLLGFKRGSQQKEMKIVRSGFSDHQFLDDGRTDGYRFGLLPPGGGERRVQGVSCSVDPPHRELCGGKFDGQIAKASREHLLP